MARITTPFDFSSTAADVITGIDLSGRRAVVTGGGSGIGLETARTLAGAGADVTLAVRRPGAAEMAASDINAAIGSTRVRVAALMWPTRTRSMRSSGPGEGLCTC